MWGADRKFCHHFASWGTPSDVKPSPKGQIFYLNLTLMIYSFFLHTIDYRRCTNVIIDGRQLNNWCFYIDVTSFCRSVITNVDPRVKQPVRIRIPCPLKTSDCLIWCARKVLSAQGLLARWGALRFGIRRVMTCFIWYMYGGVRS